MPAPCPCAVPGCSVSLVEGSYEYFHYMQVGGGAHWQLDLAAHTHSQAAQAHLAQVSRG
jgi:hypothetical protein